MRRYVNPDKYIVLDDDNICKITKQRCNEKRLCKYCSIALNRKKNEKN